MVKREGRKVTERDSVGGEGGRVAVSRREIKRGGGKRRGVKCVKTKKTFAFHTLYAVYNIGDWLGRIEIR